MLDVFSIYDSKGDVWLRPFFAPGVVAAQRAIAKAALEPTHDFAQFGEDFTLFRLGMFDESSGDLVMEDAKLAIGVVAQISASFNKDSQAPASPQLREVQ